MYRLALSSMDRLANQTRQDTTAVPLESQVRPARLRKSGEGNDEPQMQFHQPDETFTNESLIADMRLLTPEDIAARDEMVAMVELALRTLPHEDREAFILFTMEGFTMKEIAVISNRTAEQVRASIASARDHLKKSFPSTNKLKDRLAGQTKSA